MSELRDCPKCGPQIMRPYVVTALGVGKYQATSRCPVCGLRTRIFEQVRIDRWPQSADDFESNEDAYKLVQENAAAAWNAGDLVRFVSDVKVNREALLNLRAMIDLFLYHDEHYSPAERVLKWDALKRKWRDCGRVVSKEEEYDAG